MPKLLFFDCESTGLPKDWKAPMHDLDNWPRVIQLAFMVADMEGTVISRQCHLIRPEGCEGWIMPTGDFWKDHGFTQEESLLNGIPIWKALELFINDLNQSEIIVSHNMSFDYNVIGAEMIRAGLKASVIPTKICTKEISVDVCKIPFGNDRRPWKNNNYKWPKLSELYNHLFKKDFDNAHDALGDVEACKDCFFELYRTGVIEIEPVKI